METLMSIWFFNVITGLAFQDPKALFRCENFLDFATVVLSFVCGKYCPIMN